jgi:hypothetical protein
MSPRLLHLTEKRAHAAFWRAIAFMILAVHAGHAVIALAMVGSIWAVPVAAVALFSIRGFLSAFKRADLHFAALERNQLSRAGAWQRPPVNTPNCTRPDDAR